MHDIVSSIEGASARTANASASAFRTLFDHAPDAVLVLNMAGIVLEANAAACRMHATDYPRLIGKYWFDFVAVNCQPQTRDDFACLVEGGTEQTETVLGCGLPVEIRSRRIDWLGQAALLFHARDISEHKRTEEHLRHSIIHYCNLVETSSDLMWTVDCEGRFSFVNRRAAEKMLGYSAEELIGRPFLELQPPERAAQDAEVFASVKPGDTFTGYESSLLHKNGTVVHILANSVAQLDDHGQIMITGNSADITGRKLAEEALRASEAKYRTLIENLEQHIILKDCQLRFAAANRLFCDSVGTTEAEIIGKTDFDIYPRELAEKYRADDVLVLTEARKLHLEERALIGDRMRSVRVVKTPVKDEKGRVEGVLIIFWDITEQVTLEMQLRHAQKMDAIGQLAGGVAHDFNNLLTVILGNLSLFLREPLPTSRNHALLQDAEQAALRAADLTKRLLGFSRRSHLCTRALNLTQAVDEAVRFLSRTLDPRIHIEVSAENNLWLAQVDPGQINQVLMNLAVNARDAMPHGGLLRFEISNFVPSPEYLRLQMEARPGEFVRLRVRDTGAGIPPEIRQRIFEPFFTTKDLGKGTGLGLATVFGIIKQHQGWIECHSEVNKGTSFDFFLPRALHAPAADEVTPLAPRKGTETILLVDDEPMVRNLGRLILEGQGYTVLLAKDGLDAVTLYQRQQERIRLVVMDGAMPHMSGKDALIELGKINPRVRVLFSSGMSADQFNLESIPQFAGFIDKPYRIDQLTRKVRETLDG